MKNKKLLLGLILFLVGVAAVFIKLKTIKGALIGTGVGFSLVSIVFVIDYLRKIDD